MFFPLLFRLVLTLIIAAIAGGFAVWRHPVFLTFLVLEAGFSLVEGFFTNRGRSGRGVTGRSGRSGRSISPKQVPFLMSGKRYLLLRMGYDAFVIGYFARRGVLGAQLTAPIAVTGITLIISAIALRAWSMMTLGERFRSFEVRAEEQGLETHGPYAMVRHPGYLALVLFDVGMPLLLNSALLLPLLLGPLLAMLHRVSAEEQLLRESYPAEYPAYAGRTRRFVPLIY